MNHELTRPSPELAARVLRQVTWDERLEGQILAAGPGTMTERLFSLVEASNLLGGMPSFTVEVAALAQWTGETLGDAELAQQITALYAEQGENERAGDAAVGGPEPRVRERVAAALDRRVRQCEEVLGLGPERDESSAGVAVPAASDLRRSGW